MHVYFSFEHDTGRNDTGYRTESNLITGNWKFQRLLLDGWGLGKKHLMISCNPLHINFMNFPAGIWETTRSRSSRQGYFQIYFPCKPCKLTKHHSFVYYFITDLEESEDLFWHQRIGDGGLGGWRGDSTVCWLPIVWLRFSAFFFFLS